MNAPASTGGKDFEKHPAGGTAMVCTRIIDKGSVLNPKDQTSKRKLVLVFESSKLMQEGEYKGQPFLLFANFNFSMYQNSHLCKFIEAWQGQRFIDQNDADAFDIASLLGKPMFASVVVNGDWTNVESPMPMPDGIPAPTIVGKSFVFSFQAPDVKAWEQITEGMQNKMKEVPEYKEWVDSNIPGPDSSFETMPDMPEPPPITEDGIASDLRKLEDDPFA